MPCLNTFFALLVVLLLFVTSDSSREPSVPKGVCPHGLVTSAVSFPESLICFPPPRKTRRRV